MKYIIIFACVFLGVNRLLAFIGKDPLVKNKKEKEEAVQKLESIIAPYIKMNPNTESKLGRRLYKAGKTENPREYVFRCCMRALPWLLLATLLLINGNSFVALYMILLAGFFVYKHMQELNSEIEKKERMIIEELPEFMSYMTNSLKSDRDITKIIASYMDAASPVLKRQLKKLLADLRTGNIDEALHKFDIEINLTHLSNYISVVRATLEGETQLSNLESITTDMEYFEYETAKRYAEELPGKVAKASFAVGAATILFLVVMFLYTLWLEINQFL